MAINLMDLFHIRCAFLVELHLEINTGRLPTQFQASISMTINERRSSFLRTPHSSWGFDLNCLGNCFLYFIVTFSPMQFICSTNSIQELIG